MEDTMCASSTLTTPQNQVDALMQEVADEAGSVCVKCLSVSLLRGGVSMCAGLILYSKYYTYFYNFFRNSRI